MATDPTTPLDALEIVDPQDYADHGYPHAALGGVKHLPVRLRLDAAG